MSQDRPTQIDEALFDWIARQVPPAREIIAQHVDDYGELLAYLAMADLVRWFLELDRAPPPADGVAFLRCIDVMLDQPGSGLMRDSVSNLASIEFTELLRDETLRRELWPYLGEATRKDGELQREHDRLIFLSQNDPDFFDRCQCEHYLTLLMEPAEKQLEHLNVVDDKERVLVCPKTGHHWLRDLEERPSGSVIRLRRFASAEEARAAGR